MRNNAENPWFSTMLEEKKWGLLEVYSRDARTFAAPHKDNIYCFGMRTEFPYGKEKIGVFELNSDRTYKDYHSYDQMELFDEGTISAVEAVTADYKAAINDQQKVIDAQNKVIKELQHAAPKSTRKRVKKAGDKEKAHCGNRGKEMRKALRTTTK